MNINSLLLITLIFSLFVNASYLEVQLNATGNGISFFNGISSHDQSGTTVSSAGDVNNDGYQDFLINAPKRDIDGNYEVGMIINGRLETNSFTGLRFSAAGDVNQDGYDDILLGEPTGNWNGINSGNASLIFGGSSLPASINATSLNGTNGVIFHGVSAYGYAGNSVSSAGDVNNDTFPDFLIGALEDIPDHGEVYLIWGNSSWPSDINLSLAGLNNGSNRGIIINGTQTAGQFSRSMAPAGDVNNDSCSDFLISDPYADPNGLPNAGQVFLFYGCSPLLSLLTFDNSQLNISTGVIINGTDDVGYTGLSVSGAGDVNGDGYDDLLVGASDNAPHGISDAGNAYIVFGSPSLPATVNVSSLNSSFGITFNGADPQQYTGWSVSGAGDVNNDGYDDFIIGTKNTSKPLPDFIYQAGLTYLIFGRASFPTPVVELSSFNESVDILGIKFYGHNLFGNSGNSVSGAGDVNNDSFSDFLIGAYTASVAGGSENGQSYLISGVSLALPTCALPGFTVSSQTLPFSCIPCAKGSFSSIPNSLQCELCPYGHYANALNSTSCTPCAPGSFSFDSGAATCDFCPPGSYTEENGRQVCIPCEADLCSSVPRDEYGSYDCLPCDPPEIDEPPIGDIISYIIVAVVAVGAISGIFVCYRKRFDSSSSSIGADKATAPSDDVVANANDVELSKQQDAAAIPTEGAVIPE